MRAFERWGRRSRAITADIVTGAVSVDIYNEKSKFYLDITNLDGKRGLNRSGVLAGANFIALRRACW